VGLEVPVIVRWWLDCRDMYSNVGIVLGDRNGCWVAPSMIMTIFFICAKVATYRIQPISAEIYL